MDGTNSTYKFAFLVVFTALVAGLLWSRALLSVSHGVMAILAIIYLFQNRTPVSPLLLWSCTPVVLFFFGWYQQPLNLSTYDYLLSLLMYPVAALASQIFAGQGKHAIRIWLVAGLASLLYPLIWYATNFAQANLQYGQGQSLPTFMEGDHVRYGIFVSSLLLAIASPQGLKTAWKNALTFMIAACIIIMSVRTAWAGLLIIVVVGALSKTFSMRRLYRMLAVAAIPVCIVAYLFVPTVRQKVQYVVYDFQQYNHNDYKSSDGTRRVINDAAWNAVKNNDAAGSGWAEIRNVVTSSFKKNYPGEQQKFYWPFNQWPFWIIGGGFIGAALFTAWLLYPLWWGIKHRNTGTIAWTLVIAATCMVESTTSLQYGIFLHAWPLALLWNNNGKPPGKQLL